MNTHAMAGLRPATTDEFSFAVSTLRSLDEADLADLVSSSLETGMTNYQPVVATDFTQLTDEQVVLVPMGAHALPRSALEMPRHWIGLPHLRPSLVMVTGLPAQIKEFPTLLLVDGDDREVVNFDNGQSSELSFYPAHLSKFAHLTLDAQLDSILEMGFSGTVFSQHLLDVTCTDRVDVYNVLEDTYRHGRDWVREAYGESGYRARDLVERGLDGLNEGGLKVIDAVFNPLIAFGEKLDRLFGK